MVCDMGTNQMSGLQCENPPFIPSNWRWFWSSFLVRALEGSGEGVTGLTTINGGAIMAKFQRSSVTPNLSYGHEQQDLEPTKH